MSARREQIDKALETRGIDPDGPISRYGLKELIRVVEVCGGRLRFAALTAAVPSVLATYDTDPDQGANAAIVFTAAREVGSGVDPVLKIAYANTAVAGSETVAIAASAGVITITVGISTGVSTAAQVRTALSTANAAEIMTNALKAGNDGTGAVVTMAAKTLAGGVAEVPAVSAGFVISPS
jgi:hypothetical protein